MHAPATLTAPANRYAESIAELLATALREEAANIRDAARTIAGTFSAQGILYVFGSGHSHMFAEEAFYRAGGAARVCPVLKPAYMLHEGAVRSTRLERESGHADAVLAGYQLDAARDCMIVVSNSGANALPIEVAASVRSRGMPVIAITSRAYANSVDREGPRLHDIADTVVDNHCPPGDALVELSSDHHLPATGPASTVVGLALLNTMIVEACATQLAAGSQPELFLSANMPGAENHNRTVREHLAGRIPHL
jgi:uncharacterized phosphosugar-binding protein